MAITVRQLTRRKELGLSLVAGAEGADRVISWAHSIELADPTPWLSGGELVMTTGLAFGPNSEEQFRYVAALARAGTAALAVDTGMRFERVPDGIRSAADQLGFPVLAVPASTPFIAITRAVIDELTEDQVRAVQRVVDQQELFARAILRAGIPGVVAALARELPATAVFIDSDHRVQAASGPEPERVTEVVEGMVAASARNRRGSRVVADANSYCAVQSVAVADQWYGHLAVRTAAPMNAQERLLTAHTVSLIAIELGKPAAVVDAEQRLRSSVLRALLDMPEHVDPSLLRYFGLDADQDVVAVAFVDVGPLLGAEAQLARALAGESTPYLMGTVENEIVVLVPGSASAELGSVLRQSIAAQLQREVRAGRGLPVPARRARDSVWQAVIAARSGSTPSPACVEFSDLGVYAGLLAPRSTAELRMLSQAQLGPLVERDNVDGSGDRLVDTVAAFLEHNGEIAAAATALGIHRHTMRHRMAKIEELLSRDLGSANTRADLWAAVAARRILVARGGGE